MQKSRMFYDSVYFDTDEDITDDNVEESTKNPEIGASKGSKRSKSSQRAVLSNDELLYGPELDDLDEAWVIEQIQKSSTGKQKGNAKTDAILTCPMCFTPLCYSCQRHERYTNQYRAMFVTNCRVVKSERYCIGEGKAHKSKTKADSSTETYYKVQCETCDTHVAMMDEEEVYHFFNVIAN